jgi:hypothetical protein
MSSRVEPRALGLGTADEAFRGRKGGPQWNIAECVAIRALGLKVIHHIVPILARSRAVRRRCRKPLINRLICPVGLSLR